MWIAGTSHFLLAIPSPRVPPRPCSSFESCWSTHGHKVSTQVGTGVSNCCLPVGLSLQTRERSVTWLCMSVFYLSSRWGGEPMQGYTLLTFPCISSGIHIDDRELRARTPYQKRQRIHIRTHDIQLNCSNPATSSTTSCQVGLYLNTITTNSFLQDFLEIAESFLWIFFFLTDIENNLNTDTSKKASTIIPNWIKDS